MRNVILLISFFIITPFVLLASIVLLAFHNYKINTTTNHFIQISSKRTDSNTIYAALPSSQTDLNGEVGAGDTRVARVKSFFSVHESVLEQYSQNIVDAADQYNIDYTLLPAISMQESQVCKREIPDTYNCWGWGIYHGKVTRFENYPQAINTISKLLSKNYIQKGHTTLEEIQQIYNPSNTNNWHDNVNQFMNQVQNSL